MNRREKAEYELWHRLKSRLSYLDDDIIHELMEIIKPFMKEFNDES